jgi:Coenzyme PQQ synthesis protein D (PqqD)
VTDTAFQHASSVLWRAFDQEVLVASPMRDDPDRLAGPAATVWRLLERPRTLPELLEALGRAYQIPAGTIMQDVEDVLDELDSRGWIERVNRDSC